MIYYVVLYYFYQMLGGERCYDRGRHYCVDEDFYNG
jgi:hypothetical protein